MKRSTFAVVLVAMCTAIGVSAVSQDTPTAWVVAQAPAAAPSVPVAPVAGTSTPDHPGFYAGEAVLNPSERAGERFGTRPPRERSVSHLCLPAAR